MTKQVTKQHVLGEQRLAFTRRELICQDCEQPTHFYFAFDDPKSKYHYPNGEPIILDEILGYKEWMYGICLKCARKLGFEIL